MYLANLSVPIEACLGCGESALLGRLVHTLSIKCVHSISLVFAVKLQLVPHTMERENSLQPLLQDPGPQHFPP